LGCECSKKANEQGFIAFALGFYGECFGADDQVKYNRHILTQASSSGCIGHDFKACNKDAADVCIGRANTEYIYILKPTVLTGKIISKNCFSNIFSGFIIRKYEIFCAKILIFLSEPKSFEVDKNYSFCSFVKECKLKD